MRNFITQFSRIFVGLLFIVSGLIKLNDPIGFSYKLGEYFSEPVLNLPFLEPAALPIAVFIVIFEALLGVMLLMGFKRKFTAWSLLLMIVFFTFLTFYSAYFNKVTDCGCFGDALHLTPWQSFTKDIVLLVFVVVIFVNKGLIRPFLPKKVTNILVYTAMAACIVMAYYVLNHLPIIDFRAYKVGTNIPQAMEIPPGAPKSVVEMTFIYNVNGQKKEFTEKDLMNLPPNATFVDRVDKVIQQGYLPPVHDFTMEKDGEDHTAALMAEPDLLLLVSYDLSKADPVGMQQLEDLFIKAAAKGYKVVGMTASSPKEIAEAKEKYGLTFDYYFGDATTLKTIERANPSIVVVHNGTIAQKLHYNDIDKIKL